MTINLGLEKFSPSPTTLALPPWKRTTRFQKSLAISILIFLALILLAWNERSGFYPPLSLSFVKNNEEFQSGSCTYKNNPFRWEDIKPSKEFEYVDCYNGLQCARLELPMDHNRRDGKSRKIAVAVIRLPAKVPVTDSRYGGAILTNPGGPGGSGVGSVLQSGRSLQKFVDSDISPEDTSASKNSSAKYFDIIGFDPRGVNNTTPTISCFPNSFSRQAWTLQAEAEGMLGSSDESLRLNWRRSRARSEGCSRAMGTPGEEGEALGEFVHTAAVATDMVDIIERHAQWLERQGKQAQKAHDRKYGHDRHQSILARTKWTRGQEKLQYWGFSYGTILGATFASMYPERSHRIILDGVGDSIDYYNGTWARNLYDTDKILEKFAIYCDEAGPELCRFYREGGPSAIIAAYNKLLSDIWADPLSVPATSTRGPEVITWTDLHLWIRISLYQPLKYFPLFANVLTDLTLGNGSYVADLKQEDRTCTGCPTSSCENAGPYSHECNIQWDTMDATTAILCTDGIKMGDVDEEGFRDYWQMLKGQSEALGDYWAKLRLGCVEWNVKPKGRFSGSIGGNTSHPILFIGNTLDTVTPLRNAKKMSAQFPGSVVLEHGSEGHCSFSAPSICTTKAVRKYFQTGILPPPETICETDVKPLLGVVKKKPNTPPTMTTTEGSDDVDGSDWGINDDGDDGDGKDQDLLDALIQWGNEVQGNEVL